MYMCTQHHRRCRSSNPESFLRRAAVTAPAMGVAMAGNTLCTQYQSVDLNWIHKRTQHHIRHQGSNPGSFHRMGAAMVAAIVVLREAEC